MRSLRLCALAALFCIDVHVKAETVTHDCWGKKIPCAVQAHERKVLTQKDIVVSLKAGSLVEQRNEETIQLVSGRFYIEASSPIKFATPYAKIWCEGECKGLFERSPLKLQIKSLEGHWLAQRTGEQQTYTIPAGFQIGVSEVVTDGAAEMDFPQSLPWLPTVSEWASLYPGKVEEFKPTLVKFREVWKEAVEAVSVMHEQVVHRAIASNEQTQAKERARRAALEREDKSLRDMFRDKNP